MPIKYFQTAWNDIRYSKGWFGRIMALALVNCIPIFGQIVTLGYLYGWAREMSWGIHNPLPASIFSNADGKLYRRGLYLFIIAFVFGLVGSVFFTAASNALGLPDYTDMNAVRNFSWRSISHRSLMAGGLLGLAGFAVSLFFQLFIWVGSMRSSIYDRLSAGFQLDKIWKMIKHDTSGILRILGMYLLIQLIASVAISIIAGIFIAIAAFAGVAGSAGAINAGAFETIAGPGVGILVMFLFTFMILVMLAALVVSVLSEMLVARALGHWMLQFRVPEWRGQDDPLPFELETPGGSMPGGNGGMPIS